MKGVFALMLTAALLLGASAAAEKRKVEPLLLPMPLYNQHDYAEPVFTWHERDVTVEESGCGAACVASGAALASGSRPAEACCARTSLVTVSACIEGVGAAATFISP